MAIYSELPQEERFVPLEPDVVGSSERPWKRFAILCSKVTICLLAVWGIFDIANTSIVAISKTRTAETMAEIASLTIPSSATQIESIAASRPVLENGYVKRPSKSSCRCGSTISEALANDCKYDSHATAWLPPHCRDDELLEEWERSGRGPNGAWEYFAYPSRNQSLTVEEVSMLADTGGSFWMTHEWHIMVSSPYLFLLSL